MKIILSGVLLLVILGSCTISEENSKMGSSEIPLIIGTYTQKEGHVDGKGEGIYVYSFDTLSGDMRYQSVKKGITNPSFVSANSTDVVVAVSETDPGEVVSYLFDTTSYQLKESKRMSSYGSYPCYVDFGVNGENVFVVNYGSGTIAGYKSNAEGNLSNFWQTQHVGSGKTSRQESPHPHMVANNPHNPDELYIADLGIDAIVAYKQSNGTYRNTAYIGMPRGTGPRHLVFHPTMKGHMYVINELSATVSHLVHDEKIKTFKSVETQKLYSKNLSSEDKGASAIDITPNGKYLYTAVRGEQNEIVVFEVKEDGSLSKVQAVSSEGLTPREIKVDPSGNYLLVGNQDSSSLVVYKIGEQGKLVMHAKHDVPTPVSFAFIK